MRIGQERALEELYDATVGKLYALAAAILRSPEEAEEIVCETYAYVGECRSLRRDPRQRARLAADALSQSCTRPVPSTPREWQRP